MPNMPSEAEITFAGVVEVIRKSLKRRRNEVRYNTIVRGAIRPSELEEGWLEIGNATRLTEVAVFKVPCNRKIIVRHTIGETGPGGADIVKIDIPYYSTITVCRSRSTLRAVTILCHQASRVRLGVRDLIEH